MFDRALNTRLSRNHENKQTIYNTDKSHRKPLKQLLQQNEMKGIKNDFSAKLALSYHPASSLINNLFFLICLF